MYHQILRRNINKCMAIILENLSCLCVRTARDIVTALFFLQRVCFVLSVTCTFTNTLKFVVKDCDPSTGEPDEEGYEDEYVVCVNLFLIISFFLRKTLNESCLNCEITGLLS